MNHHVTQYLHIIGDLNLQIAKLKGELNRMELGGTGGGGELENEGVTRLCDKLKSLMMDQRILRQQLLNLEVSLVQTTVECRQKQSHIQEWEQKRDKFHFPSLRVISSTVPSCSTTPGAGKATVDAEPLIPQYHVQTDATTVEEAELKDNSNTPVPTAVDDSSSESSLLSPAKYLSEPELPATPEPHPTSLQEAIRVSETSPESSPPHSARQTTKINVSNQIEERFPVKPHHIPGDQLLLSADPTGSSDDQQDTQDNNGKVTEPQEIQMIREELLLLQTKKEKMDKNHKYLQKKLQLTKDSIDRTKEVK